MEICFFPESDKAKNWLIDAMEFALRVIIRS